MDFEFNQYPFSGRKLLQNKKIYCWTQWTLMCRPFPFNILISNSFLPPRRTSELHWHFKMLSNTCLQTWTLIGLCLICPFRQRKGEFEEREGWSLQSYRCQRVVRNHTDLRTHSIQIWPSDHIPLGSQPLTFKRKYPETAVYVKWYIVLLVSRSLAW